MRKLEPTRRFSGRQTDYSMGRPGYPRGIIAFLSKHRAFSPKTTLVADIGSGTGKLTALFLGEGNSVYAVEPNHDMRREAEIQLAQFPNFHSIEGSAEKTMLPDRSIDLVSAGQAFHWFDQPEARKEFSRILKPPKRVLLVWNTRRRDEGTFGHDYEELIEKNRSEKRGWSSSKRQTIEILEFFKGNKVAETKLRNGQKLDLPHLLARIRSASYMPKAGGGDKGVEQAAKQAFAKHELNGYVTLDYNTEVYLGKIF